MPKEDGHRESGCRDRFACAAPLLAILMYGFPYSVYPDARTNWVMAFVLLPLFLCGVPLIALGFIPAAMAVVQKREPSRLELVSFAFALLGILAFAVLSYLYRQTLDA